MITSKKNLKFRIELDGGIPEVIFNGAISVGSLPEGTPERVRQAWQRIQDNVPDVRIIEDWLEE